MEAGNAGRFREAFVEEIISLLEKEGERGTGHRVRGGSPPPFPRKEKGREAGKEKDKEKDSKKEEEGSGEKEEVLSEEISFGEKIATKKKKGKEEVLPLLGLGLGTGAGLARHIKKHRALKKEWKRGRADPPITPKSKKMWDILRKPHLASPHLLRRAMGGAALGYISGRTLESIIKGFRRKKKKRA